MPKNLNLGSTTSQIMYFKFLFHVFQGLFLRFRHGQIRSGFSVISQKRRPYELKGIGQYW